MNSLHEVALEEMNRAERAVFTMATGALALSVTFRTSLVGEQVIQVSLLKSAWIGFTVSSCSYIFGLLVSSYVKMKYGSLIEEAKTPTDISTFDTILLVVPTVATYSSFFYAVISFTRFAILQL